MKNINIGLLHSLTGVLAESETPVRNATLLAINEINNVSCEKIIPLLRDCESNPSLFALYAEELIVNYDVKALFGCWSSVSRKAVLPVLEKYNVPLYYPVQYEGCESSPYVFYLGATANQQVVPGVDYIANTGRSQYYLLGSDYVFPRTANLIITKQSQYLRSNILNEKYVPLNYDGDFKDIIADIILKQPDTLFNTLNGSSNVTFFRELNQVRNLLPSNFKVMSFSIAEPEVRDIGPQFVAGDLTTWNYYQTFTNIENERFVSNYKITYGQDKLVSDPAQAGYSSVYTWYQAVCRANSTDLDDVRVSTQSVIFNSPQGLMYYFPNQHIINSAVIGEIAPNGLIYEISRFNNIVPDPCLLGYPWSCDICRNKCNKPTEGQCSCL
jgi:urea transport system substrate-binding protein